MPDNKKNYAQKFRYLFLIGFFVILSLPLLNIPPLFSPPDWGKTLISRSITAILTLFVLGGFVQSRLKLWDIFKKQSGVFPIPWLLAIFSAVLLLSAAFSLDRNFSFWGDPYRAGGFINLGSYILLAIISFLSLGGREWKKIWNFNILIGILVAAVAIFQQFRILPSIFIPSTTSLPSTIGGPIFLGIYLLLLSFIALSFGIQEKNIKTKIFYFTSLLIFIWVMLLSGSQAALLGLGTGALWFFFLFPKNLKILKIAGGLLIISGVAALFFVKSHPPDSLRDSFTFRALTNWQVDESRLAVWKISLKAIKDRPILGFGPENFSIGFDRYYDPSSTILTKDWGSWWDRAHNVYIEMAATEGLPLIAIYLSLFAIILWKLQKAKRNNDKNGNSNPKIVIHGIQATLIGYFIANIFSFDTFSSYLLIFLFIAYSLHLLAKQDFEKDRGEQEKNHKTLVIIFLSVFTVYFLWFFNAKPLFLNRQVNIATYESQNNQCNQALDRLEKILNQKTILDHYAGLKYIDAIKRCANSRNSTISPALIEKAVKILKENIKIRPYYTRDWLLLGNFENMLIENGKKELKEETYEYFQKAYSLSPKRQETLIEWAKTDLYTGDYQQAKIKSEKCAALNENTSDCWWLMGLTQLYMEEKETGKKYIGIAKQKGYKIDSIGSLLQMARVYNEKKDYNELIIVFKNLINTDTQNMQYHASLAFIYKELGDYKNARLQAQEILKLAPENKAQVEEFLQSLIR